MLHFAPFKYFQIEAPPCVAGCARVPFTPLLVLICPYIALEATFIPDSM